MAPADGCRASFAHALLLPRDALILAGEDHRHHTIGVSHAAIQSQEAILQNVFDLRRGIFALADAEQQEPFSLFLTEIDKDPEELLMGFLLAVLTDAVMVMPDSIFLLVLA